MNTVRTPGLCWSCGLPSAYILRVNGMPPVELCAPHYLVRQPYIELYPSQVQVEKR